MGGPSSRASVARSHRASVTDVPVSHCSSNRLGVAIEASGSSWSRMASAVSVGDVELSRIAQNRIDADKGFCVGRFDACNGLRRSGHRLGRRKISGEDGIERLPSSRPLRARRASLRGPPAAGRASRIGRGPAGLPAEPSAAPRPRGPAIAVPARWRRRPRHPRATCDEIARTARHALWTPITRRSDHVAFGQRHIVNNACIAEAREVESLECAVPDQLGDGPSCCGRLLRAVARRSRWRNRSWAPRGCGPITAFWSSVL